MEQTKEAQKSHCADEDEDDGRQEVCALPQAHQQKRSWEPRKLMLNQ